MFNPRRPFIGESVSVFPENSSSFHPKYPHTASVRLCISTRIQRWTGQSVAAGAVRARDMMISQPIIPVPITVRETLINTYCPEQNKPRLLIGLEDHVCVIRL
jgi:hypothetical protein